MTSLRFRAAGAGDAATVALLHARSWRRHYRGAYADAYLDGDVVADRRSLWSARLAAPDGTATILAEDGPAVVGFTHVIFDRDERWGSLLDNLHVAHTHQRAGIGTALLTRAAAAVAERAATPSMYLWVLEQNTNAQGFYRALGGSCVERAPVPAPGGVPERLNGSPMCFRFVWPDTTALGEAATHATVTDTTATHTTATDTTAAAR